jgi:hypothetical protein
VYILHKINDPSSRLRVLWRQMTQLWKVTDLSTKIVISTHSTPFNKYQYHVQIVQAFWFFLLQKTAQLFIISIFWLWAWKCALWKLFQKNVVDTKLYIYVCMAKLIIQIEKKTTYLLFFQRRTNMVWSSKMLCIQIWTACNYRW